MKLPLIAGVLALAASAAFANEPTATTATDPAATFKSLDADGNGRISESEARAHPDLSAGYRSAVADANGGMTMEEFNAWHASKQSQTPPSN
ncbi:MAG TPA: hypothetical protein VFR77_01865 [Steroidobacteraceae bacterium]|nr:hypothetical protein [Steroidobacteraceae bacterium]